LTCALTRRSGDDFPARIFIAFVYEPNAADALWVWFEEERNLYEDYELAFGSDPPRVAGIGIMTGTGNTGESAIAYYGDITLLREPSLATEPESAAETPVHENSIQEPESLVPTQ
jgi:hypothetical protein